MPEDAVRIALFAIGFAIGFILCAIMTVDVGDDDE